METRIRNFGLPHFFLALLFGVVACGDSPTAPAPSRDAPRDTAPSLPSFNTTSGNETGQTLFGIDPFLDELNIVDSGTGDATTVGGLGEEFGVPTALAIQPSDGTLFSWDNRSEIRGLITVDRATGTGTVVSRDQGSMGALAFAPDGRLLALENFASGSDVFEVDPETGVLGPQLADVDFSVGGADFGPDGRLYVVGVQAQLVRVDLSSGTVETIGSLTIDVGHVQSIAFDETGRLLGTAFEFVDGAGVVARLFSLDPTTAEVFDVQEMAGVPGLSGMVFDLPPTTDGSGDTFLFGHDNSASEIVQIDLSTGNKTSVGPTGFSSGAAGIATARADVPGPGGATFPAGTHFGLLEDTSDPATDWVVVVDTENGRAVQVVKADRDIAGRGVAFGPDGSTLYVIESTVPGALSTISTVDGTVTPVGETLSSVSLEWDPDSGAFLSIASGSLHRIDPASGAVTLLGSLGLDVLTLARSPGGSWFTHSTADGSLYGLEISTPWAWRIGGSELALIGGSAFAPVRPAPVNEPPQNVSAGGPYSGSEGAAITMQASGSDPEGTTVTFTWDFGDGTTATGATVTHAYADDGVFDVTVNATDADGNSQAVTTTATIANVPPVVESIAGPQDPLPVGTEVSLEVSFTDPGTADAHSALVDWGDGSSSTLSSVSSPFQPAHVYAAAGVYTVTVTVTDDDGGSGSGAFEFVVVFDSDAGFVTGGGWIDSPPGAYSADPTLTGKASFGFVSRYEKGATTPSGNTQFRFRAGDLTFHSSDYEWLVVAGARAQFKGTGTVNGLAGFGFMIVAVDAEVSGGGDEDGFRIKIWESATDEVVYDNQMDESLDSDATSTLGGGSIVIHGG
jgi:PKD repeat protein